MTTPYKQCSRDDVADCRICGSPLAGDNDTGICYKCSQIDDEQIDDEVDKVVERSTGGAMICPICETKRSEHYNELGKWYDCPNHGFVKLIRYSEEENPLVIVQEHDEYVDAVERSREATA